MYSCHNFVLARAAGSRNRRVLFYIWIRRCSCWIAVPGLCCSRRTFQCCRQFSLCPFFPFILAGSPSHGVSNQRNQTSRPPKSSPSLFPSSANVPGKKLPVRQDNALASKTGKTYPRASFQKSSVHQGSIA